MEQKTKLRNQKGDSEWKQRIGSEEIPEYITVGASGGIFGLIGACLSDIIMNWKHLFSDFVTENGRRNSHVLVVVFLIVDILLNCLIGLTPYVDNFTRKCHYQSSHLFSALSRARKL